MLSTYKIQDSKSEIASESSYGYQPKIVVFFLNGVPGAGKGTQCEKLLEMLPNYRSLSTGALLRDLAKGSSPRAQEIAKQMECGELVDIDATKELLIPQFKKYLNKNISMFIIDGFPRDRRILKDWKNGMKDERYIVPFMIEFDCDEDIAVNRLLARKRSDDTEEAIRNRINVFKQKTGEIMNIFKKQKKYRKINSNGNKQDISEDLYNLIVPYYKYFEFIKQIYNKANQLYNNNNNNNNNNNSSSINDINNVDNNIVNNNNNNGSNIYNRIVGKTLYMVAQCLENENIMCFIMAIVIGGNYCCRQVLTCTKVTYLLILGILIFTISSIQFFV